MKKGAKKLYNHLQSLTKHEAGNKAFNLSKLVKNHLNVPDAIVLPIGFFDCSDYENAMKDLAESLEAIVPSKSGWAVRSSSIEEDTSESANAGKYQTMFISKAYELPNAVWNVLKSGAENKMAVIIQKFIDADFSGVAFSKDPVTYENEPVVEIVEGSGEKLVGGLATPAAYKKNRWVHKPLPGISTDQLTEIATQVKKVKEIFGYEVDMEFCVKNGVVYWVQVRPITSAENPESKRNQDWFLLDQCTEPIPLLLEKLDPSGLFHSKHWDMKFVNHFPYFRLKPSRPQKTRNLDILEEWHALRDHYEPIFDDLLHEDLTTLTLETLWERLNAGIRIYRQYCENYMDRGWLQKRRKAQMSLNEAIKIAFGENVNAEKELTLLSTGIETITAKKYHLLNDLVSEAQKLPDFKGMVENIQLHNHDDPWVRQFYRFIEEFGFESPHPVTCHLPTLAEKPESVLALIQHFIDYADLPIRSENPDQWTQQAALIESKLPEDRKSDFREQLRVFRDELLRTENDDYLLQKGSSATRMNLLEIGRRLERRKLLKNTDEIFHLLPEELENAIHGHTCFNRNELDGRMEDFRKAKESGAISRKDREGLVPNFLNGQAASVGKAEGIVYKLHNPLDRSSYSHISKNAVIVAWALTPNLVYNLLSAVGIITEVGGFLSHGAIFAREKGIPAIVAVDSAMDILKTGDKVRLDAEKGTIEIIQ